MVDRRSQRIREHLKRQSNPRIRTSAEPLSFAEQIRRVYSPPPGQSSGEPDCYGQLARQLETQRKSRR